tara:strand:- start:9861 stop:10154 length:294 start_codon:yes stop_codon:yes gene_type:complete
MKYGMKGTFYARKGKGNELIATLKKMNDLMKTSGGCEIFEIELQMDNNDIIHVYELWTSQECHAKALKVPGVNELVGKSIPLIKGDIGGVDLKFFNA